MNHFRYSSIAAAVAIGLGGLAFAQSQSQSQSQQHRSFQSSEHGQRAMRDMSELDRDRDQRLSQDEARSDPNLVAAWAEIDVSRDGSVDATEYYLYAAQRRISELEGTSQPQALSSQTQPGSGQSSTSQSSTSQSSNGQPSASSQSSAQSGRAVQPSTQTPSSTRQSNAGDQDIDVAQADRPGSSQQSQNRASDTSSRSTGEQPSFDEADRNNDGQIDRQEYESARL